MIAVPERSADTTWAYLFGAWLLATLATAGSLFFSVVMDLPPCNLCWVQRIFMFPLPLVLGVALHPHDPRGPRTGLALALPGLAVAGYHTLLYLGVLPEAAAPCRQGVSCTQPSFELFGVLSIPLLSLLAFGGVTALLLRARTRSP